MCLLPVTVSEDTTIIVETEIVTVETGIVATAPEIGKENTTETDEIGIVTGGVPGPGTVTGIKRELGTTQRED